MQAFFLLSYCSNSQREMTSTHEVQGETKDCMSHDKCVQVREDSTNSECTCVDCASIHAMNNIRLIRERVQNNYELCSHSLHTSAPYESELGRNISRNKKRLFREILEDLVDDSSVMREKILRLVECSRVIVEDIDKQCRKLLGEKFE